MKSHLLYWPNAHCAEIVFNASPLDEVYTDRYPDGQHISRTGCANRMPEDQDPFPCYLWSIVCLHFLHYAKLKPLDAAGQIIPSLPHELPTYYCIPLGGIPRDQARDVQSLDGKTRFLACTYETKAFGTQLHYDRELPSPDRTKHELRCRSLQRLLSCPLTPNSGLDCHI